MADWRPIKTAPKDGSPMLMWLATPISRNRSVEGITANTAIGFWLEGGWKSIECEDCGAMGSTLTGWMNDWQWIDINPTHWMPLPESPK